MSSSQNDNRIQKITQFLSEILSGELSGYKIQSQDDELVKITRSALKLNLITGVNFNNVSDKVVMIDYSDVSLTDKGREALNDNGFDLSSTQNSKKTDNVLPLNPSVQSNPEPKFNVQAMVQRMDQADQSTANLLLQALNEGRSNQLVYQDYLDFFNRNPDFYNYFISAGQENSVVNANQQQTPLPAEQPRVEAQMNQQVPPQQNTTGIFSPEVQKIIAELENQPAEKPKKSTPVAKDAAAPVEPVQKVPNSTPALDKNVQEVTDSKPVFEQNVSVQQKPVEAEPKVVQEVKPKVVKKEPVAKHVKSTTHVVISYVDQDEKEIASDLSIQLTSQNSTYDVTSYQKKIHDYEFIRSENAIGQITGEEVHVLFHYEAKIAKGNIRVNYVDQQGEKIAEQKIVQGGHIREFYPLLEDLPEKLVDQIHARRYILQSILADNDPTDSTLIYFSDRDQNFTAIFRELVPGKITLRYLNLKHQSIGIGERIMENNVENGDKVAIPLPLVPTGYELDETLLNGDPVSVGDQFTVSPDEQVVDYMFKRVIADGAIIFNYVDQDGREIAHQTTKRGGRYGEVYDFEDLLPQVIRSRINEGIYESNPVIKEEDENGSIVAAASIVFDNSDHEYSAVFQATEAANITLKFVTTDDNPIPEVNNKVVQGTHYYGDTFIIPNAPEITGFDLNRIMVNDKPARVDDPIMYNDQEQTVTYVYTIATSKITAHHVDQLGRQIAEDRILTGQIGTTVEQSQLVSIRINPYFVLSDVLSNNNNYTFTTDPQVITFHYQVDDDLVPDVSNVSDVMLINCLDTNGNIIGRVTPGSIHLDTVKVGHVYSVHAPDFAGYHLFSQIDAVRIVWNSEKPNDFTIVNHPNGLAFIYQAV